MEAADGQVNGDSEIEISAMRKSFIFPFLLSVSKGRTSLSTQSQTQLTLPLLNLFEKLRGVT